MIFSAFLLFTFSASHLPVTADSNLPLDEEGFALLNGGHPLDPVLDLGLDEKSPYVPNRLVVKLTAGFAAATPGTFQPDQVSAKEMTPGSAQSILLAQYRSHIQSIKKDRWNDFYIVETYPGTALTSLKDQLQQDPLVDAVSYDYYATITAKPDDSFFAYQYALENTAQLYLPSLLLSGKTGCDIKAINGWDWTTGSDTVIIAVIDTGVAGNHEDLSGKLVPGYNFVAGKVDASDDHGHGTMVASIIAASSNNGKGMAGVAWNSKIMPIKSVESNGLAAYTSIAAGMNFAADNGAQVLNLSLGGFAASFILEDACKYAYDKGCVIVAATGNQGIAGVLYPAAYDDYCLAVSATDAFDEVTSWSNYGPQVDVAAPGDRVFGCYFDPAEPNNLHTYVWASGTSFSTPYVAGAAALVLGYKSSLTPSQVMDIIKYTADDVNKAVHPGIDSFIGYGRLNLERLLGPYELSQK